MYACMCARTICILYAESNNMAEAKVCESRSKTFTGICISKDPCKSACLTEGAFDGSCHADGFGSACFCYFNC